jgi:hypothetical protein
LAEVAYDVGMRVDDRKLRVGERFQRDARGGGRDKRCGAGGSPQDATTGWSRHHRGGGH